MNKNSEIEMRFRNEALKRGYHIYSKGYPDYVIVKGNEVIFVECKRPMIRETYKMGFSKHQVNMIKILKSLGLNVKIYRGNWWNEQEKRDNFS
jgi:hypothetical protein